VGWHYPPLYKTLKVSKAALLLTSRDRGTQQVALRALHDEESWARSQLNPTTYCRDVMVNDPGAKRQTLAGRAKRTMDTAEASRRQEEVEALPVQGQMMRASSPAADAIWAAAVCRLGSDTMK